MLQVGTHRDKWKTTSEDIGPMLEIGGEVIVYKLLLCQEALYNPVWGGSCNATFLMHVTFLM